MSANDYIKTDMPEKIRCINSRNQFVSQPTLPGLESLEKALQKVSTAGIEKRGAIYTRREVVEFILDLVGFSPDRPLHKHTLLEPSFGEGDFLIIAAERLVQAWQRHSPADGHSDLLAPCIRAVELHENSFQNTRDKLIAVLRDNGLSTNEAEWLASTWLIHDDFLLTSLPISFDYIIGNPPYIRQELIPDVLVAEYRARYRTVYDRADIYIPFIERSLNLLAEGGTLGFICANRWMKNRYGGPLRQMIAEYFHLRAYIDMVGTPAFHSEVIAYPAITVVAREKPAPTRIVHQPEISKPALSALAETLRAEKISDTCFSVKEISNVVQGAQPWLLETSDQLALVQRLERDFPAIEDAGCKVGIGVATGADKAFIGLYDELDVEADRKLPLAMTRDITSGEVAWRGYGIINPFADDGGLVDLNQYPRLQRYLEAQKEQIAKRHIARKTPANWYRTIDRIYPALAFRPKLLIPDIKGEAQIVYEPGNLYPHHNLYYIISYEWDLRALQAVLLSGIGRLFIATYSTRMRGGYLRFQAQYLRRIRLPRWWDVPSETMNELVAAAYANNRAACDRAVIQLYRLTDVECRALTGNDAEYTEKQAV